jgi:hypothetical protein
MGSSFTARRPQRLMSYRFRVLPDKPKLGESGCGCTNVTFDFHGFAAYDLVTETLKEFRG